MQRENTFSFAFSNRWSNEAGDLWNVPMLGMICSQRGNVLFPMWEQVALQCETEGK